VLFNVAQLLKSPTGSRRSYQVDDPFYLSLDSEVRASGPIQGNLKLLKTVSGVMLTGSLTMSVELPCCRCLQPFAVEVRLTPEDEFLPRVDLNTGAPLCALPEDPILLIDEHHLLDPTELLNQLVALSIPIQPICDPACPGICPHCGKALREGPCSCEDEILDPRLQPLKELLTED
jgi:uncharacterized protein